jgi:hypothetical protein
MDVDDPCVSNHFKSVALALAVACLAVVSAKEVFAQVSVNGYYRSNGTYVQPHQRTAPDGIKENNYSYGRNYNPNSSRSTNGWGGLVVPSNFSNGVPR